MLQPVEDLVDCREGLQLDIRLDLALGGKGERLGHILAGTDEGTADGDAIRHHIEERDREVSGRQADKHASTAFPGHLDTLLERRERGRGDKDAVSAAAGFLLQGGDGIAFLRIDRKIGAKALGMGEFPVIDIDGADLEAHDLRILNPQMSEAANTGDSDPFAGLRLGFLNALVGGDAGADQRCGFGWGKGLREYGRHNPGPPGCIRQIRRS